MSTVDDALQHHNRERHSSRYDTTGFTVETGTLEEWRKHVNAWGNGEGWNIGFHDAECFLPVDPEGFFLGKVDGRPVSAVSLVNYDDRYAVWGHYLVAPGERGKGYGIGVCKVASRHAGQRVTAGDAMPVQVQNYSRDGSHPVHDTVHFAGALNRPGQAHDDVVELRPEHLDAVADFDARSFPARRTGFLQQWCAAPGHRGVVAFDGAQVVGYGVVRPAPIGHRIGPWTATSPQLAERLLDGLTADFSTGDVVSFFAPDVQPAAAQLITERGLSELFRVVRMYRGEAPERRNDWVYAIGSLELG